MALFPRRRHNASQNLDQQLVFQLSKARIPSPRQLKYLGHFIKGRERILFYLSLIIMVAGLILVGSVIYRQHIEAVPTAGGQYIEGVVGNPQYINPLYAPLNPVDADLERLIFSRLFTINAKGETVPDLVNTYELSQDQKTYTITLREARWPDGSAVTIDDILFTFQLIQNPEYRSPLRSRFLGVTAEKKDDTTLAFTLTEPYGQFPSLLDFGILPNVFWEGVNPSMMPLAELNLKPVGSGPYQLKALSKTSNGTVRSYTLERNPRYYGQSPYLDEIVFKFFPSPEEMIGALNKGQLQSLAELPTNFKDTIIAKNALDYRQLIQPQLTALFFNLTNKGVISDTNIRKALRVVNPDTVKAADTIAADSVLMPQQVGHTSTASLTNEEAAELLEKAGYQRRFITDADVETAKAAKDSKDAGNIPTLGEGDWAMKDNQGIIITLTAPESLRDVAERVGEQWKTIGVKTNLNFQKDETIQAQTISGKNFEVLLYTEALDQGDPYPFWTTNGPGNVSSYSNKDVDTWLADARLQAEATVVADRYQRFQSAIANDVPAIPLYWKAYIYPQTKKLHGQSAANVENASDRLTGVEGWYFRVKRQWK